MHLLGFQTTPFLIAPFQLLQIFNNIAFLFLLFLLGKHTLMQKWDTINLTSS